MDDEGNRPLEIKGWLGPPITTGGAAPDNGPGRPLCVCCRRDPGREPRHVQPASSRYQRVQ